MTFRGPKVVDRDGLSAHRKQNKAQFFLRKTHTKSFDLFILKVSSRVKKSSFFEIFNF